jgi:hypothetical protein
MVTATETLRVMATETLRATATETVPRVEVMETAAALGAEPGERPLEAHLPPAAHPRQVELRRQAARPTGVVGFRRSVGAMLFRFQCVVSMALLTMQVVAKCASRLKSSVKVCAPARAVVVRSSRGTPATRASASGSVTPLNMIPWPLTRRVANPYLLAAFATAAPPESHQTISVSSLEPSGSSRLHACSAVASKGARAATKGRGEDNFVPPKLKLLVELSGCSAAGIRAAALRISC